MCCGDTTQKTRHILLMKHEAINISTSTKRSISDFAIEVESKEPYTYEMKKTAGTGKCLFLKENRCTIYSKRPLICRFYPFGLEAHRNQRTFYFTNECPGIGKGKLIQEREFKKLEDMADSKQRQPS
jgi:Fe-S-cluster containining protein